MLFLLACGNTSKLEVIRAPSAPVAHDARDSIVAVEIDGVTPDLSAPWGTGKPWTRTLSGLAVEGHHIVVGGWELRGHKHIRVERLGTSASTRSSAHVLFEDPDQGLTLLATDDDGFWQGLPAATVPPAIATPRTDALPPR
jgi:hypothetical protein